MEEYNIGMIIGAVVCALYVVYMVVMFIVSRVRAKKIGILCVKYPIYPARFAGMLICLVLIWGSLIYFIVEYHQNSSYIDAMKTRGITAIAKRQNKSVDELLGGAETISGESYEEIYLEREIASYEKIVEQNRITVMSGAVGTVMVTLVAFACFGAYITKAGLMIFTDLKPQKIAAEIKDGKICFYNESKPDKILAKFPASEENKELFSGFIEWENSNIQQPT